MAFSALTGDDAYAILKSSGSGGGGASVSLDKTLSKTGQAAEAKAAGDAIAAKMDKTITDSGTGLKYQLGLENGIMTFTEVE